MSFGPCSSCRRHVRVDERVCPFCRAAVNVSATPAASKRLSRAAVMAFTTLGVAVAGCPKTREPETVVQPYGAPPQPQPDTGVAEADPNAPSPTPSGVPVALYGAPAPGNRSAPG